MQLWDVSHSGDLRNNLGNILRVHIAAFLEIFNLAVRVEANAPFMPHQSVLLKLLIQPPMG